MRCGSFSAACSTAIPRARLGLGHLGETLPFLLWRFDSRAGPDFYNVRSKKPPSQYIKENIVVTTSGMCSAEPLNCTIAALGHERDHVRRRLSVRSRPRKPGTGSTRRSSTRSVRADIAYNNAVKLLKLPA